MKEFHCFWKNMCGSRMCCSLCKKKNCEWRCLDDCNKCKFRETGSIQEVTEHIQPTEKIVVEDIKVRAHNVVADRSVIDKLIKYKKSNKLKICDLSKKVGVNESTLSKIMRDPVSKIRSDSYNKIKEFVKTVNTADKRKLW